MANQRQHLERRNALWQCLRAFEPHDPGAAMLLQELSVLIRWPEEKIFAALGWPARAPQHPCTPP